MKKIILMIILILLISIVNAQEMQILKEAKNTIGKGDNIDIKITFNNPYKTIANFEIKEVLPEGITLINPNKADNFEYNNGILKSYYKWKVTLKPQEIIAITYTIKPDNLGEYGVTPTIILNKISNLSYSSNSIQFNVYCKSNNICEDNENYLNCPLDCNKGIKDNICNYKLDNLCDPDCTEDPDCSFSNKSPLYIILIILLVITIVSVINYFIEKRK